MKSELFEAEKSVLADKELASESSGTCATQASEWEERQKHKAKSRGTTRSNARMRTAQSTSNLGTQSGEVLRRCRRDRGEKRKFVNKSDGEQTMKALKDATAKTLEGVASTGQESPVKKITQRMVTWSQQ